MKFKRIEGRKRKTSERKREKKQPFCLKLNSLTKYYQLIYWKLVRSWKFSCGKSLWVIGKLKFPFFSCFFFILYCCYTKITGKYLQVERKIFRSYRYTFNKMFSLNFWFTAKYFERRFFFVFNVYLYCMQKFRQQNLPLITQYRCVMHATSMCGGVRANVKKIV